MNVKGQLGTWMLTKNSHDCEGTTLATCLANECLPLNFVNYLSLVCARELMGVIKSWHSFLTIGIYLECLVVTAC